MSRTYFLWPLLLALAVLHGCATQPGAETGEGEGQGAEVADLNAGAGTAGTSGAEVPAGEGAGVGATVGMGSEVSPAEEPRIFQGHPLDDPDSLLAQRVIYFDYDSSSVRNEYLDVLSVHAGFLGSHPEARVSLEGHSDERGSREYNLALAERRADGVAQMLMLQGVPAEQIEIISYGEERPARLGHDDPAWEANRRVEIIYLSR